MTTLDVKKSLPTLLKPEELDCVPASIRVKQVQVEDYVDWDGDNAIRATVVVDDSVNLEDESVTGKDILDLNRAVQDKIQKYGYSEFVYVRIVSENESEEDSADLPDSE